MKRQSIEGSKRHAGGFAVLGLALVAVLILSPARANARARGGAQVSVGISVSFGPPPLPVYTQPMCPGPGYIWTPGYWAYDPDDGYYWVPGTWVMAPFPGALWTPGYWGWDPAVALFVWHPGYWGPRVGFYGGINYGFGYFGVGYDGGYWRGGVFFYNRAVTRVNIVEIHNVYYREDFHHRGWDRDEDRISYNGGRGGIDARPTREDFEAERERRMGPLRDQEMQREYARRMPEERWSENHGRPGIAATYRPGRFMGRGVERAVRAGGPYRGGQPGDAGRQQNGWHAFGQQPSGQGQRAQQDYRHGYQQHANYGGGPARSQVQPGGWRQQPQPRDYRGGQGPGQPVGWGQAQQRDYRGRQQQQRYQGRPDYRQRTAQPNWNRQQPDRRPGQVQRGRGNPRGQQARPNRGPAKRDNPHGGRHR